MAAGGDKTEKATPKKREDERKKGNIFQSKDIVSAFSILAIFYMLKLWVPFMYKRLSEFMLNCLNLMQTTVTLTQNTVMGLLGDCLKLIAITVLPLLLMAVGVGIVATGAQTKFRFAQENLKIKFSRMSPLQGFKRMFSLRSAVELIKSLAKILVIVYVLWGEFKNLVQQFSTLLFLGTMQSTVFILDSILNIVMKLSLVFIGLSILDYLYQWWEYERNIRMSKQEIKEEYKQMEGDPHVKGQIKERQRKFSMQRMMQQVPSADVIVRNPTHFAVALKYDLEKNEAPIVVAKGQDHVAFKIIEVAQEHQIPMTENKPLARALYAAVDLNQEIPPEFYNALAEIMAWVYTTKQKEAHTS